MAQLISWDGAGDRFYETGVDHGVLYPRIADGSYPVGVAWNGLISVTESPEGAEATKLYADNIKYLNLISAEELKVTIEAYTYPDEFGLCDGSVEPGAATGVLLGQQARQTFGLSYRTVVGNDVSGNDLAYKLHLLYGCTASPSEKGYSSINDSPEAITFSWSVETIAELVTGYKPTSLITIDSRTADPTALAALETILYGVDTPVSAVLPLPDAVIALMTP